MTDTIRIFALARECACHPRVIIDACDSLGIRLPCRSALVRLQIDNAMLIKEWLSENGSGTEQAVASECPSIGMVESVSDDLHTDSTLEVNVPSPDDDQGNCLNGSIHLINEALQPPTMNPPEVLQPVVPPAGMDGIQWLASLGPTVGLEVHSIRPAARVDPEFGLFKIRKETERFLRTIGSQFGIAERCLTAVELIEKVGGSWSLASEMTAYLKQVQRICNRVVHPGYPGKQKVATMQNVQLCAGNLACVIDAYLRMYRKFGESAA